MRLIKTLYCVALLQAISAPGVKADEWNRKTVMTFSGPVEIPGVHLTGWEVLPAGTYVFKILHSLSDRHIVQIFNKEETAIYATVLAIPNYRLKVTDKTVVTFSERPAGQPEALRAWFYPGRNFSEEFVYSKSRAMELSKETHSPVLFTSAKLPSELPETIKNADAPVVAILRRAQIKAVNPTGNEIQLAEVVDTPPAQAEGALAQTFASQRPAAQSSQIATPEAQPASKQDQTDRPRAQLASMDSIPAAAARESANTAPVRSATDADTLPATASSLPFLGLAGLLAFGAAMILRALDDEN